MSRKWGYCLSLELLERRELLAADVASLACAEGVSRNPADVNGDSVVSSADVAVMLGILKGQRPDPIADVNCDGFVTSLDILQVINELNRLHQGGDGESPSVDDKRLDVDGSGVIDARDAAVIERHLKLNGATRLPSQNDELYEELAQLDVNDDGYITPLDMLQIGNEIARLQNRTADSPSLFARNVDALFSDDLIDSDLFGMSFSAG